MLCCDCENHISPGEQIFSIETGIQRFSKKMNHVYFQQIDETISHLECSAWFDMTPQFINTCNDVDECAMCVQPIDCDEQMVRIRIGVMDMDGNIMEQHEKFREVYLHPDCATTFLDDDVLCWNT